MPILPQEPDLLPETLLDDWQHLPGSWWVIYTLARREKELMRRLRTLEIGFYCPLIPRRTRSPGGRTRTSYVPLFANYVFMWGDDAQRQLALTTNCISRCLQVGDGAGLARDLRQVRDLISRGAPLTPEARIEPGQIVRVKSGRMAGLEGVVVKRRGRQWLLVSVEFLQQGASVLLEDFQVEAV